jgi:glycosyltransferase involved in cell wall biosynthesis
MQIVMDGIIYQMQAAGGISRLFNELLPRMCQMNPALRITLLTSDLAQQAYPSHPNIRNLKLPWPRWWYSHDNGRAERWLTKFSKIFWQITFGDTKKHIWQSTYFSCVENWRGPRVVTVYDMTHEYFPALFPESEGSKLFLQNKRHSILHADAIICISATTGSDLLHFYGEGLKDKIQVIPLGYSNVFCEKDFLKSPFGRLFSTFMLYVGSRADYKNFAWLLETYATWDARDKVDLVVVGEPWHPAELALLAKLGIAGRVHLLDKVMDEQLCYLYNQALAYVSVSSYEGFGIPLIEAMACGCPIIASQIPVTQEVAGEIPIYFELFDQTGLVAAFDRVRREGRLSARSRAGLSRAQEFSWERTAQQTLEVYRSLSG